MDIIDIETKQIFWWTKLVFWIQGQFNELYAVLWNLLWHQPTRRPVITFSCILLGVPHRSASATLGRSCSARTTCCRPSAQLILFNNARSIQKKRSVETVAQLLSAFLAMLVTISAPGALGSTLLCGLVNPVVPYCRPSCPPSKNFKRGMLLWKENHKGGNWSKKNKTFYFEIGVLGHPTANII